MLAILIECAKQDDEVASGGALNSAICKDTILFMEYDMEKEKNIKSLLSAFEQMWVSKLTSEKRIVLFWRS